MTYGHSTSGESKLWTIEAGFNLAHQQLEKEVEENHLQVLSIST